MEKSSVNQFKYKLHKSVIWYEALYENSPLKGPGGRGLCNNYLSLNILQEAPSCSDRPTIQPSNQWASLQDFAKG